MLNETWQRWVQNLRQTLSGNRSRGLVRRRRRALAILHPELLESRVLLTAPSVLSIARTAPFSQDANSASVSYTVTFSEDVSGVTADDFRLITAGSVHAAAPVVVTPVSGSVYAVEI